MTYPLIVNPYAQFLGLDGKPLTNGQIYIGDVDTDPETNQVAVYWDADLTIPAQQPLRTNQGYPWRNGAPALFYTADVYSIKVLDSRGRQVLYNPSVPEEGVSRSDMLDTASASHGSGLLWHNAELNYAARTIGAALNDIVINVKMFPWLAKGDGNGVGGGTNDSAAIQAALTFIKNSGKKGKIWIPGGIYRCDSGLTLDASVCSIESNGATLDFTNMVPAAGGAIAAGVAASWIGPIIGAALTITSGTDSYVGGGYYEYTGSVRGIRVKGKNGTTEGGTPPAAPNDQIGIYFYAPNGYTSINPIMESVVVSQFYTGVAFGQNEFGVTFNSSAFAFCGTCVSMPQCNNAGERNVFMGCQFTNSINGFDLQNAFATTRITNCSIDGMSSIYVYMTKGDLAMLGCHLEGDMAPDYANAVMIWVDDAAFPTYSYVTMIGNTLLAKTQHANNVVRLDGAVQFAMYGGFIEGSTAGSAAIFGGGAVGTFLCDGVAVNRGTVAFEAFTNPALTKRYYDIYNTNSNNFTYEGTYTPTLTAVANVTGTGTPWVCNYQKVGKQVTVWGAIQIDPAVVGDVAQLGIELPIASNFTVLSDLAGHIGAFDVAQFGVIYADTVNDRANVAFKITDTTNANYSFSFTYTIK